jgi:hypothetical protein
LTTHAPPHTVDWFVMAFQIGHVLFYDVVELHGEKERADGWQDLARLHRTQTRHGLDDVVWPQIILKLPGAAFDGSEADHQLTDRCAIPIAQPALQLRIFLKDDQVD